MNQFIPDDNRKSKALWYILLPATLIALGFAGYQVLSFSIIKFLVLGVSLIVALIVNQHQITIPHIRKSFSVKELVIFWGAIWLGVAGGVLIAAGVSAGKIIFSKNKSNSKYFYAFASVTSIFLASNVFYLILNYFGGFSGKIVADQQINYGWLFLAAVVMVGIYYLTVIIFKAIFPKADSSQPLIENKTDKYLWNGIIYL